MPDQSARPYGNQAIPHTPIRSASTFTASGHWSQHSLSSSSSSTTNSSAFWLTPPKAIAWSARPWGNWRRSVSGRGPIRRWLPPRRLILVALYIVLVTLIIVFVCYKRGGGVPDVYASDSFRPIRPTLPPPTENGPDPLRWLEENSNDKHVISKLSASGLAGRPRAAIISLVRNSELEGMMQSMRQLEYRWNRKYQYPWVFFNNEPFSDEFKAATRNLTTAECHYEVVPKEHWELPSWIDEDRFMNGLEYLGSIGVGKGWMVSYHHMCRWNSGFFYKHPFLKDFDWYWRVEPDVHFLCEIEYDVFRFMRDNNMKYGFNMNILDDARSFPSLWSRTREFLTTYPHLLHPDSDLSWLLDPQTDNTYNNCQFFSNFEIGSLNFWRSPAPEAYFNNLDLAGGFYYERFGDAPVHTLSVAMFVPKEEQWFFRDIGYQHDINYQCPSGREGKCDCEPTELDANFYKLVPIESPQVKPKDTCLRLWLGGEEWVEKRERWTMEGERAFGGDGYHGYVLMGDE